MAWYDDVSGFDDVGLDDVGAPPRRRGNGRIMQTQRAAIRSRPPVFNGLPGVPPTAMKMGAFGLGSVTFAAASGTALVLGPQQAQVPFQAERLVIQVNRTGGTATGLVTVTAFTIGIKNQLAGTAALPAEAFAPNAFDVRLMLDPAGPGINVAVNVAISAAPAAADVVVVSAVLIGRCIS